jgi:hypothetical protein
MFPLREIGNCGDKHGRDMAFSKCRERLFATFVPEW